jgi:hypothetical protein
MRFVTGTANGWPIVDLIAVMDLIGTSSKRALEGVRVTSRAPSPVVALAMTKAAVASMVSGTMDEDYTRRHL